MRQTNYQLFDFLDFDPNLDEGERLWRACSPTGIKEQNGEIIVSIPFQKQKNSNEITPDLNTAKKNCSLRVLAYGDKILRVLFEIENEIELANSEMLQIDSELKIKPLSFKKEENRWLILDENSRIRVVFNFNKPEIDWWSDLQPAPQETLFCSFFPDGDKEVKMTDYDMFSPARHDAFAMAYIERDGVPNRTTFSLYASPDECFMGTGERFSKMDLSGKTLQLRNQDGQGVNNRRTYKNIPFYISSEMYGLFLHTTSFGKFSLADHSTRSAQVMVEEPYFDVFLIGGKQPEEILYGYRQLTGFPSMPPLWSFGIWMSRMTYFSADEIYEICNRLRKEDYPCDVIHIDTGWFETDWLCEWKFNKERFPDPKGFIKRLKDDGYRVSLWQLPYISYDAEQYEEAVANNYISKSRKKIQGASNFSVQDYAGTIDFTYDKAIEWYKELLRRLLNMGVTCIKADFGEDIHLDAEYHSMSAEKLHNIYPLLYQKAAFEITKEVTGENIIWARAAWAGSQRYPIHWGGDSASSWDGMAGSLKGGLHIGLSGFGFWSHDVPGFHSIPDFMNSKLDDDVYVRWTQFGVFTSHIRYHGSHKREPWFYPKISHIIKKWWKLRYKLIPYIIEQSELATHTGYPVIRAMWIQHPTDKTCLHIDDQYYFGENMLVAPVMNSENKRDIYLPEGKWVHLFTGEIYEGNLWLKDIQVPLDQMPVFVKFGVSIPFYTEDVNCTDEMDLKNKTENIVFDSNYNPTQKLKI